MFFLFPIDITVAPFWSKIIHVPWRYWFTLLTLLSLVDLIHHFEKLMSKHVSSIFKKRFLESYSSTYTLFTCIWLMDMTKFKKPVKRSYLWLKYFASFSYFIFDSKIRKKWAPAWSHVASSTSTTPNENKPTSLLRKWQRSKRKCMHNLRWLPWLSLKIRRKSWMKRNPNQQGILSRINWEKLRNLDSSSWRVTTKALFPSQIIQAITNSYPLRWSYDSPTARPASAAGDSINFGRKIGRMRDRPKGGLHFRVCLRREAMQTFILMSLCTRRYLSCCL